jgi:hypothetical protein
MFNPKLPTSRAVRASMALIFGCYGAVKLYAHYVYGGRPYAWLPVVVGLDFLLSLFLPESASTITKKAKPEKYHFTPGP